MDDTEKGRVVREIGRVLAEAEHVVYQDGDPADVTPLIQRLRELVSEFGEDDEAIIVMEARAFLASFDENLPEEIRFTTRVVELRRRLLDSGFAEHGWTAEDLIDVLGVLAALHAEANEFVLVRQWVTEAQRIAQQYDLPFDAEQVMKDLAD